MSRDSGFGPLPPPAPVPQAPASLAGAQGATAETRNADARPVGARRRPAGDVLQVGELHRFAAAGREFAYLVSSAGVFALQPAASAVLSALGRGPMMASELAAALAPGLSAVEVEETVAELEAVRAIERISALPPPRIPHPQARTPNTIPLAPVPLSTLVVNVTNRCNLSCTYCYEYGEDRIADQNGGSGLPKRMSVETAQQSVDLLLRESGRAAHLTFFGGETLLNFPVLKETIAYARARAAQVGKTVDFSLTTNATLLTPEIIEFLAENDVGVTISIDGPRDVQDRFRVFRNGAGSYDRVLPGIRELLRVHRRRPVGARVTLTNAALDVGRIFRHLTEEIGFQEVGFAPVTTASGRAYAIDGAGFDRMLEQFRALAFEFLEAAVADCHHAFSNVKDTLEEIHKGMSKAYPCGAGFGLMGVATNGEVALCHRFAGSDRHRLGHVAEGLDRERQRTLLAKHHIDDKTDCRQCWARPLCAGGCYHEAYVRYGDTSRPNLHYCEWIRGWTDTCLEVYGALSVRNPKYLERFDREQREVAV